MTTVYFPRCWSFDACWSWLWARYRYRAAGIQPNPFTSPANWAGFFCRIVF